MHLIGGVKLNYKQRLIFLNINPQKKVFKNKINSLHPFSYLDVQNVKLNHKNVENSGSRVNLADCLVRLMMLKLSSDQ